MRVGCIECVRRLNPYNAEVWVAGPNKNRISIALSIERNSGMNIGARSGASDRTEKLDCAPRHSRCFIQEPITYSRQNWPSAIAAKVAPMLPGQSFEGYH